MAGTLPDPSLFPARLQSAMDAKRLKQIDLASMLGVSRSTVHRWIGGAVPEIEMVGKIATVLDCDARWLYGVGADADPKDSSQEIMRLKRVIADLQQQLAERDEQQRKAIEIMSKPQRRQR